MVKPISLKNVKNEDIYLLTYRSEQFYIKTGAENRTSNKNKIENRRKPLFLAEQKLKLN